MRTDSNDGMNGDRPQVFIKTLTFNDGTSLDLNHNSIVVFTGPNNCGKSQILKDIEKSMNDSFISKTIVIDRVDKEFCGDIDEQVFFTERFSQNKDGLYTTLEAPDYCYHKDSILQDWRGNKLKMGLSALFVKRLSTEERLTASNALSRSNQPQKNAIYKLNRSEKIAQNISDLFYQAFGVDLIINRNEMQNIPLHVGHAPNKKEYTIDRQDDYYDRVRQLPLLQDQGDGMRSFASILLDTFTSVHTITLIDEPEAFLHPPQARILGKMLARNNPDSRQLFISTHSEDFLQGIIDADCGKVTVIRIEREDKVNEMSSLQNTEIKKLWGNPILRYSNILSGLFHERVIVCESDYDCLFYQAIMNAIFEERNEVAPDILFTHCGGKARIKDVVSALKAVNVPVAAICDFDLLNSSQVFKAIVNAFGIQWEPVLGAKMKIIYDDMNGKRSNGTNAWDIIKRIGKAGFTDNAPAAYEEVEKICRSAGLFVVPVGEMECFDKTINKEKKEWVYYVLENYDLAKEHKLDEARAFVNTVLEEPRYQSKV